MKFLRTVLLASTLFSLACVAEDLPAFIHVCHRNDPDISECFKVAGENLRPFLVTGLPEYGIPSMEPLIMDELISEETSGLRLSATNVKAWGCSNYLVQNMKIDIEKQKYEIDVLLPFLKIQAHYNIAGKILVMSIRGEGPMEANITNCKTKVVIQGELFDKDGETYLRYTNMSMKVDIGDGHVKMENLFNGDKFLTDTVNETINKNLKLFLNEIMPFIERSLALVFLDTANKIVGKFTVKQLFPN